MPAREDDNAPEIAIDPLQVVPFVSDEAVFPAGKVESILD